MDIETFLQDTVPAHTPRKRDTAPLLLYDECVNHPIVHKATSIAVKNSLVLASFPAWSQLRQKSDGSFLHLEGRTRGITLPSGEEFGLPVKGWKFTDEQILEKIIASFITTDRIIFLSENTRNNQKGIRKLLEENFKPAIKKHNHGRLGLLALMKKGNTSWESYANEIIETLERSQIKLGYEYRLI